MKENRNDETCVRDDIETRLNRILGSRKVCYSFNLIFLNRIKLVRLFMESLNSKLPVIGWREWVKLPDFGARSIKAKVDSGARSSALHAHDIIEFERDGNSWVRFTTFPVQRNEENVWEIESPILEFRKVRSSNGKSALRPVIVTPIILMGIRWDVELTLTHRGKMGFRMLLGREAFRNKFLLDAGHSYLSGKPKRKPKKT